MWERLETRARGNNWQLPQYGDLDILTQAGFIDTHAHSSTSHTHKVSSDHTTTSDTKTIPSSGLESKKLVQRDRRILLPPSLTAPAISPLYRIDYIWSNQGGNRGSGVSIKHLDAYVAKEIKLSDHLPVITDFHISSGSESPESPESPELASGTSGFSEFSELSPTVHGHSSDSTSRSLL